MKTMPTVTVKIRLPDYNRKAFTDLLIEGKEIAPQTVYYQSQMMLRDTTR